MSLEHFDLSDLLESLKNDVVRKAKRGEIPGHDLSVNARSGIAACSCGWRCYSLDRRGPPLMPISPERMKLYPGGSIRSPEWRAIRAEIIKRAGNRCEGSDQFPGCRVENGKTNPLTGARVILTIGHVNHNEADCRPENLKAWCQRCHLNWDAKHHAVNARRTRLKKIGQGDLFQ